VTLRVDFDDFADSVVRLTGKREAYARPAGQKVRLTAADPAHDVIVRCEVAMDFPTVRDRLEKENFLVLRGEWSDEADEAVDAVDHLFGAVAAVSYEAAGSKVGLWMDAYPGTPTEIEVLDCMYRELLVNGEIPDVPLEKFTEDIHATVVILSANEIRGYVTAKLHDQSAPNLSEMAVLDPPTNND